MKRHILIVFIFLSPFIASQNLVPPQVFQLNPAIDTVFSTNLGTTISIPSLAFKIDSSHLNSKITIHVQEIVDKSDMILQGVSTSSDKGTLVSNGMIQLSAFADSIPIDLDTIKQIQVIIPATDGRSNMSIYEIADSSGTWTRTTTPITLTPCDSYYEQIIYRQKSVTKQEYRKWKKKNSGIAGNYYGDLNAQVNIFGPGGRNTSPSYFIRIPVDTTWSCRGSSPSFYEFNIRSMGWYNIDKILISEDTRSIKIKLDEDLDVFLLLPDENVCIQGKKLKKGTYRFENIPKKTNLTVIAYKQNGDQTVNFVMKRIRANRELYAIDKSQTVSLGVFKRIVKQLSP